MSFLLNTGEQLNLGSGAKCTVANFIGSGGQG